MKRPTRKRDTALLPFAIFDADNNTSLSLAREQEEAGQRVGKEQRGREEARVEVCGERVECAALRAFRDEPEAGSV